MIIVVIEIAELPEVTGRTPVSLILNVHKSQDATELEDQHAEALRANFIESAPEIARKFVACSVSIAPPNPEPFSRS